MSSAEIAIVVSPRDWAERLHRFVADHGGARVRARLLDAREAVEERYQVLVVEDLTSFLTPRLVATVRSRGRRVLGVYDPIEPWGRERLLEVGVDDTIESSASPEAMLRAIDALAVASGADLDAELARLTGEEQSPGSVAEPVPPSRAPITVVGGPAGGPGATEVAIGLGLAAGRLGESTVVVDADDVAPSVAQRLGLPLHPNVRTAVDVVQHWSGRLEDALVPVNALRTKVLCGLPNPRDWTELRPGEMRDVVDELALGHDQVVVNIGHRLEELGGAVAGPGRYGLARELIAAADVVVGVGAPTPVGLARLLDWVADVRALTTTPAQLVVNRAPGSSFKRGELEEELRRTYSPPVVAFVPQDRRVEEASWSGDPVTAGPFGKAMDDLAEWVLVFGGVLDGVTGGVADGRPASFTARGRR